MENVGIFYIFLEILIAINLLEKGKTTIMYQSLS
jgi:hypothetical protein